MKHLITNKMILNWKYFIESKGNRINPFKSVQFLTRYNCKYETYILNQKTWKLSHDIRYRILHKSLYYSSANMMGAIEVIVKTYGIWILPPTDHLFIVYHRHFMILCRMKYLHLSVAYETSVLLCIFGNDQSRIPWKLHLWST